MPRVCRRERRVHRHIVGFIEEGVEVDALDTRSLEHVRLCERIEGNHFDSEGLRLGRDQARDVAEADKAEHRALDAADRHHRRHFPTAALDEFVRQGDLADESKQQCHRMVGNLADAIVRHIVDGDALFLRGDQVDVIDTETEAADRPAPGQLAENLAGQFRVGDEDGVGILRDRKDVVGVDALRHAVGRVELRKRGFGQVEGRKHAVGHCNHGAGHYKLHMRETIETRAKATTAARGRPPKQVRAARDFNGLARLTKN